MIRVLNRGRVAQPVMMYEDSQSPEELTVSRARRETFSKNMNWALAHRAELNHDCRGKFVCVSGGELFVADTPREAHALARAAHPAEEHATFSTFIPSELRPKVYAN
jgi:hypothetical protein